MLTTNNGGNEPHRTTQEISDPEETPDPTIDPTPAQQQQSKRNISKRPKESGGDDSFESEHRLVYVPNQYFNTGNIRQQSSEIPPRSTTNVINTATKRPSFPPFRISFIDDDEPPSELAIIKDINKNCRISLSYGRFSLTGQKKFFLLYANSSEQFDRLMEKKIWPTRICSRNVSIDLPSKVPSSYSIVALGFPAQWNITEFELDLKKQYPTIIKVERLYVKGGIPISKVRIDFSSNREVIKIMKDKRLLLDDDNTSFAVQPYSPPMKILRCYNCQQYNDHIAANCPHKDNPVCFRCGGNHPYNPNCTNKICCANCHQDHLAGNPNCRVKIEERKKYQTSSTKSTMNKPNQINSSYSVWTSVEKLPNSTGQSSSQVETTRQETVPSFIVDISKKLDLIMNKIENISAEQEKIKSNFNNLNQQIVVCHDEINSVKDFIFNKIGNFISTIGDTISGKFNQVEKNKLRVLTLQFNEDLKVKSKVTKSNSQSNKSHTNCSFNESIDQ